MTTANVLSQRIAALAVVALGCLLTVRWFVPQLAPNVLPQLHLPLLNTPVMLLAIGAYLYCSTLPSCVSGRYRRAARLLLHLVVILSSMTLAEHLFSVDLGIDFVNTPIAPTVEMPNPGRVAPNTCLAFLAAALCLYLATLAQRTRTQARLMTASAVTVLLISMAALLGHFLNLNALYQILV